MSKLLRDIKDWPERAVRANWCVATLAKDCKVSPSTLARHFTAEFGMCPHEWMNEPRMRVAGELLVNRIEMSVKEISVLMGYANQHAFSLAFKKHHSHTPSEHRKRTADPKKMENRVGNQNSE